MKQISALGATVALFLFTSTLHAQTLDNPFFVFHNGLEDETYNTIDKQMQLLLDNGYSGMEKMRLDRFSEYLEEANKRDLKLYTIYFNVDLDKPEEPYDVRFEEVLKMLEGSNTMFWIYVTSKKYKPSSIENDAIAVPIFQEMADIAQEYGIKLMLYPHMYFWVESPYDALRVAKKVNRRNFGMAFNLCHYLAYKQKMGGDPEADLPEIAEESIPYLFAISLNGADKTAPEGSDNIWASYIQPLGDGSYDTYGFLKTFLDLGFEGPVGLQTYNIKQDKAVHLEQSMETWKSYQKRYEKVR